jgi:hypothetical protein
MYAINTLMEVYTVIDIRCFTSLEIVISHLMVWLEPKHVGMDDVKWKVSLFTDKCILLVINSKQECEE